MLPIDDEEFLILYAAFIGLLLIFLAGIVFSKNKGFYRKNLIVYSIYTAIMIFVFIDDDNFKYGSSLVVLLYGGILILLHLLVFILYEKGSK